MAFLLFLAKITEVHLYQCHSYLELEQHEQAVVFHREKAWLFFRISWQLFDFWQISILLMYFSTVTCSVLKCLLENITCAYTSSFMAEAHLKFILIHMVLHSWKIEGTVDSKNNKKWGLFMTSNEGDYMYPDELCNAILCAAMKKNRKGAQLFITESCNSFPLLRVTIFLCIDLTKYFRSS